MNPEQLRVRRYTGISKRGRLHLILSRFGIVALLTVMSFVLSSSTSGFHLVAPYPPSEFATGASWDISTHRTAAPGSDNWPTTWADDGHLYTSWGDGGGFGGTNTDGRVSLGFGRLEGAPDNYQTFNVWGGKNPENPAQFEGKSYGLLSVDGVFYSWIMVEGGYYRQAQIAWSTDHGVTFSSGFTFAEADAAFSVPTFLNFGQDYRGARDSYVYVYSGLPLNGCTNRCIGNDVDLARVPRDQIINRPSYEFFQGLDSSGNPIWATDVTQRQPVFTDPNGAGTRLGVVYDPGIQRYIMTIAHDNAGGLGIFDAPEPWGPWSTIAYYDDWLGFGYSPSYHVAPAKWMSLDGTDFTLVWSSQDQWNSIRGHFSTREAHPDQPYPFSPVITGIEWAPASTIVREASGSDNWPMTWADDDSLYTTFGDGWGFDPKVPSKLSLGLARVDGSATGFTGVNIRSSTGEQTGDGRTGKKASGILMVDGVLYMWVRNANNDGEQCQLAWSSDHAQTWTWSSWKFGEFGYCALLNFGKNYLGARDNYVYMYSPNTPHAYNETDEVVLTRVDKTRITDRSAYEFFQGLDGNGDPLWSVDIAQRGAALTLPGQANRLDVTYNAPLGRYLMTMRSRGRDGGLNQFSIYDAPEPWGPWTTVYYTQTWEGGSLSSTNGGWGEIAHIPSKWISTDGTTFYLVFAGDDSFSVRKATLTADPLANDPLTGGTSRANVVGGQFEPEGWRSLTNSDQLHYALPDDLLEGSIEFEAKGFKLGTGEARQHVWGLYDVFRDEYHVKESSCDCNGFTLRIYHGPFGSHATGETRFRVHGSAYQKAQSDTAPLTWDENTWYRFKITWTQTRATWERDGEVKGTLNYPDMNKPFVHLYLNNDNHAGLLGVSGVIFRNVVIRGTASSSGSIDSTLPSVPTGLSATAASESQIDLTWAPAGDPESGIASYNIYRDGTKVGTSGGNSFSDTGLLENTLYSYEVSAVNGVDLEGSRSGVASGTTLADTTPPAIVSVTAGGSPDTVKVVFSEAVEQTSAENAANYIIDNSVTVSAVSLGPDLVTVTVTTSTLSEGITYTLTVSNVRDRAATPNAIAAGSAATFNYFAALVITNLVVANGAAYEWDTLAVGTALYIDRAFIFTSVPAAYAGLAYLRAANDDKNRTENPFITFDVNQDVTVYLALDARASTVPSWMIGWTDVGDTIGTDDVDHSVYSKSFAAGAVSLGGNDGTSTGAVSMYNVLVEGGGGSLVTNTAPIAMNGSVTTSEGTSVGITLQATDIDGDPLIFGTVSGPSNGGLSGTADGDSQVTYTPNGGFTGSDSFAFKANDGTLDSNTATITINVSVTSQPRVTITNLTVASGKSYLRDVLDVGKKPYIDRTFTFTTVPTAYVGLDYLRTANDDKFGTQNPFVTFDVGQAATVYLALDVRVATLPSWMNGWREMGDMIGTSDVDRRLYSKDFPVGTVTLGGNDGTATGAGSMYNVLVAPAYPTLPGMSSPAQDLDGDGLAEDTNGNGRLDFADIVALFSHLSSPEVQNNQSYFDFNGSGGVDMADVVELFDWTVSA